jgi:hypothetical protein
LGFSTSGGKVLAQTRKINSKTYAALVAPQRAWIAATLQDPRESMKNRRYCW